MKFLTNHRDGRALRVKESKKNPLQIIADSIIIVTVFHLISSKVKRYLPA